MLGEETEAARIVTRAGAGIAIPADDPRAIADALRRIVVEPLPAPVEEAAAYAYPALVERLGGVIERVTQRAGVAGR